MAIKCSLLIPLGTLNSNQKHIISDMVKIDT